MKLLVIDNMMIVPSMDVYIMINTAVKYNVKRFRQNSVISEESLVVKPSTLYLPETFKKATYQLQVLDVFQV